MKIHQDPSDEFTDRPKSRYQRYVLFRLEKAADSSPWKLLIIWLLLIALMIPSPLNFLDIQSFTSAFWMMLLGIFSVSEIYFSRAILKIFRASPAFNKYEEAEKSEHGGAEEVV